jgi:hypothetical protein
VRVRQRADVHDAPIQLRGHARGHGKPPARAIFVAALDACSKRVATVAVMQRDLLFIAGLVVLALMVGYVRDLGRKAGLSPQLVALLERLAFFG